MKDNMNLSMDRYNPTSLDTICGSLCYAMGAEPPKQAAPKCDELCALIDEKLQGRKADRMFIYNPDAIAQWLLQKHPNMFRGMERYIQLQLPLCTVMPSVTPVCFSTFYTGAQPEVHGIRKKTDPMVCDTFFDAMSRAGKKVALIALGRASVGKLFLNKNIDYYLYEDSDEGLAMVAERILKDEHDVIVYYNGYYDSMMHSHGPESPEAFGELRTNVETFNMCARLIERNWQSHDTLLAFAMDHGCHTDHEVTKSGKTYYGDHGFFVPSDMNIVHQYGIIPAKKD